MSDEFILRPPTAPTCEEVESLSDLCGRFTGDRECDHGVTFDAEAARGLDEQEVRRRWPRLHGTCPRGCGYVGIAYASALHYIMGDW